MSQPQLVWRAKGGGLWIWSSSQWCAYTGQSEEESRGLGWLQPIHPDDRDRAVAVWHEAEARGSFELDFRVCHNREKRYRWFQTRALPVRDPDGCILEWLGTSTDIDDLRQLREQQGVMVAELQHRTRNLLGVVRSIASQTMAQTGPTERFREQFNARLAALSRVQGLLSRTSGHPITLRQVIDAELSALGMTEHPRVAYGGPNVTLRKAHVQTFALAMHELATNARQHGALSHPEGRLTLAWRIDAAPDGPRLMLDWSETGAPRPPEAARRGYGRELIERALPYVLGARADYALTETGLHCTIDIPLDAHGTIFGI